MDLFKKLFSDKDNSDDGDKKKIIPGSGQLTPQDLQKHIEAQMREILKSFESNQDHVGVFDNSDLDVFADKDFEEQVKQFFEGNQSTDESIDGKVNTAQIESMLNNLPLVTGRLSSSPFNHKFPRPGPYVKRTDDEKIMDKIHGTTIEIPEPVRVQRPSTGNPRITPPSPNGPETFGSYNPHTSVRSFGQSIISQTARKPDGTFETRRIVRDSDGNTKTTITRTIDGKTESFTSYGNNPSTAMVNAIGESALETNAIVKIDQNLLLNKDGYMLPRNLC